MSIFEENVLKEIQKTYPEAEIGYVEKNNIGTIPAIQFSNMSFSITPDIVEKNDVAGFVSFMKDGVKANAVSIDNQKIAENLRDKDYIKENLYVRVVNQDNMSNRHGEFYPIEDTSLCYEFRVKIEDIENLDKGSVASTPATKEMLDTLSMPREERIKIALSNTEKQNPVQVMKFMDMTILTNKNGVNGATTLFYPETNAYLKEKTGGNAFVMIPSSLHEWICFDVNELPPDVSIEGLSTMIHEVNTSEVMAMDVLDDKPYFYENGKVCILTEELLNEKMSEIEAEKEEETER